MALTGITYIHTGYWQIQLYLLARLYINNHWTSNDVACITIMVYYKHTLTVVPTNVTYQHQQRHDVKSKKDWILFFLTLFEGNETTLRSINESNWSRAQLCKEPAAPLINATVPRWRLNIYAPRHMFYVHYRKQCPKMLPAEGQFVTTNTESSDM